MANGSGTASESGGQELDDGALVSRMRAGDERAFRELFLRFEPLVLHLARRAGVQPALRREAADDVLTAVALALVRPASPTPRRLPAYVAKLAMARLTDRLRSDRRRTRLTGAAASRLTDGEWAVATTCSEASLRDCSGTYDAEAGAASPAVAGLLARIREQTTEGERQMLAWLAERVPQRLIAEWTGTTHDAARKRVTRLRARLRAAVIAYADALPPDERGAVLRVLGRRGEGARVAPEES